MEIEKSNDGLINDLVALIEKGKNQLAYAANANHDNNLLECRQTNKQ